MPGKKTKKLSDKKNRRRLNSAFPTTEIEIGYSEDLAPAGVPLLLPLVSNPDSKTKTQLLNLFKFQFMEQVLDSRKLFAKNSGEITCFPTNHSDFPMIMFGGLGKKERVTPNSFANTLISCLERCQTLAWDKIFIVVCPEIYHLSTPVQTASWIASLAELSRFNTKFLSSKSAEPGEKTIKIIQLYFLSDSHINNEFQQAINEGKILGQFTNHAREAVSLPANLLTPIKLSEMAFEMGKKFGFSVKTLNKAQLIKLGMNGIIQVGKGSSQEPRLIIMEYKGLPRKNQVDLGIVGKGITFDSGGISLKNALNMHEMKGDMGGAAAALFGIAAMAASGLKLNVTSMIGSCENIPDANAQKPGDVYQSYKGLMVEVLNTDAEGRLVLGDVLAYMSERKPAYLVDVATLTGACIMALGNHLAGLFSNDKDFGRLVFDAGEKSLDRVWPLPLYEEYSDDIKSEIADIANIGPKQGGAITAAAFLKHFVPDDIPWAHLDIAGKFISKKDDGFHRKGSTGFGVRILFEIAKALIQK